MRTCSLRMNTTSFALGRLPGLLSMHRVIKSAMASGHSSGTLHPNVLIKFPPSSIPEHQSILHRNISALGCRGVGAEGGTVLESWFDKKCMPDGAQAAAGGGLPRD